MRAPAHGHPRTLRTPCPLAIAAPGVTVVDDTARNRFPEPVLAAGQDDVLVGRLRGDVSAAPGLGLNMFIAGDQLRKGAATNAVQIAELLL